MRGKAVKADEHEEIDATEPAKWLREEPGPLCPQFRKCGHEGLHQVQGYCVLAGKPGWLMLPSIEEYRENCTTRHFGECRWFRGAEASIAPLEGYSGGHPARTDLWSPPEVLRPTLGDTV